VYRTETFSRKVAPARNPSKPGLSTKNAFLRTAELNLVC
jgi:hypothetical protein